MNLALTSPNFSGKSDYLREERYRLLFDDNPQPMWLFDAETLAFLEVNNAAIENYGYSREEFLQMTILDIRPQEDVVRLISFNCWQL
jgi:PAS domain S-box-containing protein